MLRVMKERAGSTASEASSRHSAGAGNSLVEGEPPRDDADRTPLMSNVPVPNSISVPTATLPTSSSSSVSSEGLHILAPLTRVSEDEPTYSMIMVTDSVKESSRPVNEMAALPDSLTTQKRSSDQAFARKVSTSDLEESDRSTVSSKRRKVSLSVPPPTHTAVLPSMRLLAMPEDPISLNSLHAFCRMQIEVFSATPVDMAQPAPGRKTPIKLHQVGLRCIHCRHLTSRDRVKRAVCYPRSVNRIYHSVSDMKFDHFPHCRGFSPELRAKFQQLKEECNKRRSAAERKEQGSTVPASSTAQYYHDAACKMGLVNSKGNEGIFFAGQVLDPSQLPPSVVMNAAVPMKPPAKLWDPPTPATASIPEAPALVKQPPFPQGLPIMDAQVLALYQNMQTSSNGNFMPHEMNVPQTAATIQQANTSAIVAPTKVEAAEAAPPPAAPLPPPSTEDMILLAMPEDPTALNGLHCFVRRNVEVFIATKEDAAAPSPGRRTRVKVGQVGLRCIHCSRLPIKERVKRAVCYPPSVSGIYHSVSNMKFDHFGNCKGLSQEARIEFANLKVSSGRRNTPGASSGGRSSGSTSQYYEEAATRLGLIDTEGGIQFRHQEGNAIGRAAGESPTDGISALMIAATNPTVRADFDARRRALTETVATSANAVASV